MRTGSKRAPLALVVARKVPSAFAWKKRRDALAASPHAPAGSGRATPVVSITRCAGRATRLASALPAARTVVRDVAHAAAGAHRVAKPIRTATLRLPLLRLPHIVCPQWPGPPAESAANYTIR